MSDTSTYKIAYRSAISLFSYILMVCFTYLVNYVLSWCYGPNLMGTFIVASNLVIVFSMICTLGLDQGLLRFSANFKTTESLFSIVNLAYKSGLIVLGLSSIIAICLFLGKEWLAVYFNSPSLTILIPWFLVALPIFSISVLVRESLRGLGSVVFATLAQTIFQPGMLLFLLVFFYFLYQTDVGKAKGMSFAFIGSIVFTFILLLYRTYHFSKNEHNETFEKTQWYELWKYSYPIFITMVLQIGLSVTNGLILAFFRSPEEVAFYDVAYKIAGSVALPLIAVNSVVPPLFVKHYQKGELMELESLARTTSCWMYYLALPLSLILILLASDLLEIFGKGFSVARWGLIFLIFAQLINVASGSVIYLLNMTGNQRLALKVQVTVIVLTVPFMFLFSYKYGVNGISLATAFGIILINALGIWAVWRAIRIKTYIKDVATLTLVAVTAFLLSLHLLKYFGPILVVTIFLLAYFTFLYVSFNLHSQLKMVLDIMKK